VHAEEQPIDQGRVACSQLALLCGLGTRTLPPKWRRKNLAQPGQILPLALTTGNPAKPLELALVIPYGYYPPAGAATALIAHFLTRPIFLPR